MGNKLVCANLGDSRAVLGSLHPDPPHDIEGEYWIATPLSRDHKPNENDESERIKARGGRVMPYMDENGDPLGPYRVWLPNDNSPGLAMSRSFGDTVASSVGVICHPGIEDSLILKKLWRKI